jgi:ATP-binding protein involved in chromosome partitioning
MNETVPTSPPRAQAVWNFTPLPHVARVIAIASGKGGVGKSTATVNLALALAKAGKRVGILDADIYGPSIPGMLGLRSHPHPDIIDGKMQPLIGMNIATMSMGFITKGQAAVLRGPMITKTLTQFLRGVAWGSNDAPLDFLLIDLPPGTGDVPLSLAQTVPLDGAIIITTPQEVAVADADKATQMFLKLKVKLLGVIENMSYFTDPTGKAHHLFGEGGGKGLASKYDIPFLGELPLDPALGAAADKGENYLSDHPDSEVMQAYKIIASGLIAG